MNLSEFLAFAATRRPLDTEEIGRFMDEMSDSARRITFELNGSYHTPDEVRTLPDDSAYYEGTGERICRENRNIQSQCG